MEKNNLTYENFLNKENNIKKNNIEEESTYYNYMNDYERIKNYTNNKSEYYEHLENLYNKIKEIVDNSEFKNLVYSKKKISKNDIPHIFDYIIKKLKTNEYTIIEKIIAICDYFDVKYSKAYENLYIKYKELIIKELDEKYGILKNRKIKKIF